MLKPDKEEMSNTSPKQEGPEHWAQQRPLATGAKRSLEGKPFPPELTSVFMFI